MSNEVNIILYTEEGLQENFESSVPDLASKATFVSASVKAGTWIVYRYPYYNREVKQAKANNILVLCEGEEKKFPWPAAGALWNAVDTRETATVFEHAFYGGIRESFDNYGCPDITERFPPGTADGASSLIITPNKKWELFLDTHYKGLHRVLGPGWYEDPTRMKFPNDALKSIRPR